MKQDQQIFWPAGKLHRADAGEVSELHRELALLAVKLDDRPRAAEGIERKPGRKFLGVGSGAAAGFDNQDDVAVGAVAMRAAEFSGEIDPRRVGLRGGREQPMALRAVDAAGDVQEGERPVA